MIQVPTYLIKKKKRRITKSEYDDYHNYNIESNTNERERL